MLCLLNRNQFAPKLSQSFATPGISPRAVLRAVSATENLPADETAISFLELCLKLYYVSPVRSIRLGLIIVLPIIREKSHSRLQAPAV